MKCLQCGTELNGNKFCTNCGAPAPQEPTGPVCPNCGQPVDGKFCTKCGTPIEQPAQTEQNTVSNINADNVAENTADNAAETATQPVDYQNTYTDNIQPVQYNANTNQQNTGYNGQQFTNQPNGTYAGQQFTNQQNTAQNGKKPMSGGKIALIIVSIIVGLMIILGVIVGVVACSAVNSVFDVAKDAASMYDDDLSSAADYLSSYLDEYSSDVDDYFNSSSNTEVSDEKTGLVFEESELYDGWAVVDYNTPDYNVSKITVEIPEKFQGKEVVEIKRLYIYDNDYTDKGYIKVIIPGTVKVIDDYSVSFLGDINEVVIKDGVEKIEDSAFTGDNDLTKIHIPASVTDMAEDCGIGFDEGDKPIKDFTLYCAKGSAAEKYAKDHKLNYEIEK